MKFKYESKIIEFLILSILKSTGSMQTVIKILDDMAKFSETAQRIITELNHMIVNNFFSKENNQLSSKILTLICQFDNYFHYYANRPHEIYVRELEKFVLSMDSLSEKIEDDISILLFAIFFLPTVLVQVFIITYVSFILVGILIPQNLISLLILHRLNMIRKEIR
ncbi:MAG: hypothetical protein Q6363_001175 [Candidatus Njordarchaeota archaeon]